MANIQKVTCYGLSKPPSYQVFLNIADHVKCLTSISLGLSYGVFYANLIATVDVKVIALFNYRLDDPNYCF